MSSRISNDALDSLYDLARSEGAIGGKITGAGGGGYMLLYCPFDRKHLIASAMRERGCEVDEVALEPLGLQTWRVSQ
jgi:D-glycero-alpha-D-manno-heptose-7-phosphate kinase